MLNWYRKIQFCYCRLNLIFVEKKSYPGWSPRANQRWTALFQRFYKFQCWSALFQNGLRKPALIRAVSELFSAGFLWISAVQRWIKTNWETDKNASCKFEKVLGLRKTCSFGVYQLWKKSFRRKFSQKFELANPPFPHASWSHVTCRILKRLKCRVLSKKWTEKKAKVVLISVFFTISDQNVTNFDQRWTALNQRKTALNSSETALFQRKTALKQHWTGLIIFKSVRSKVSWRKLLRKGQVLSKRNKI